MVPRDVLPATQSLFLHEMQLGCFVTWSKHDDDVEKGLALNPKP